MDYKVFFKQISETVLRLEADDLVEQAREITFNCLDLNQDSCVDYIDLFSFLKDVKNEDTLKNAAYRDVNDCCICLNLKQRIINNDDPIFAQSGHIRDLESYLNDRKQKS